MNFPIIGSVSSAVKTMELTNKWQNRKSEINQSGIIKDSSKFAKNEDEAKVLSMLDRYKKDIAEQREQAAMSSIMAKMKSGQDLSPSELEYLKENAPELYEEYMEIQAEREAYEEKLKGCETKEEVRGVNAMEMNKFMNEAKAVMSSSMPEEAKLAAMEKIQTRMNYIVNDCAKFIASEAFQQLPETRADIEEDRENEESAEKSAGEDTSIEDTEKLKEALKQLTESLNGDKKRAEGGEAASVDSMESASGASVGGSKAGGSDKTAVSDANAGTGFSAPDAASSSAGSNAPGGVSGPYTKSSNNAYNAGGGGYNSHSASPHVSFEA